MNILVPCSLLAENILSVFRSPHLPLDTPRKAGFPFATRARKREPCPQKYVSRMIRTENFLSQIFFKVFLETTFVHVSWYPVHYQPKIFFGISKSALTPRYTILDSMFPLVMQSRKAGFSFATRARKRKPCLQSYVSRMTRTEKFRSQFFSKFFWKPLFSTFYGTLFIISRKYFSGFRSPHSAPTPQYTILDSRLLPCNAISEGKLPLCNTSSEAGALSSDKQ